MIDAYITLILNHLVICLAFLFTILPIMLIWYRKAYIDPSFCLLLIYLIIKLIIDLMMFHYALKRSNNLLLYNISIPIRYTLLSSMFYYKIEAKIYKKVIFYLIAGFTFCFVWNAFYYDFEIDSLSNHRIGAYAITLECLLILFLVLIYFYEIIRMLKIPNLLTFPFFWVCSGLLLYYSSFIFIAPVLHYSEKWEDSHYTGLLEIIPYIFETLCLLFFSIGAWFFSQHDYAKQ